MPHIIVEYSDNLRDAVPWPDVLRKLHLVAAELPELPKSGLRTRAYCCTDFVVSDGAAENAFVHTVLRMGHGRSDEAKQRIGERLFDVLCETFDAMFDARPLAVTLEIQEIHPVFNFRKTNLKAHMSDAA